MARDVDVAHLLETASTIAIVGCSDRPGRTSYGIARYLQQAGYRIVPVNPHRDEILGEPCYASVREIPDDVEIDIVNVYRRPEHTAGVVADVAARMETTAQRPVVWTQLGVSSREAKQAAAEAGLPYVEERCIMIDHRSVAR